MVAPLAVVIIMSVPVAAIYFFVLLLLLILYVVDLLALTCARSAGLKGGGRTLVIWRVLRSILFLIGKGDLVLIEGGEIEDRGVVSCFDRLH